MVHVTKPTPGSGFNPRRAYGQTHQSMTAGVVYVTAGMVHVTNLTPPGSGVQPCVMVYCRSLDPFQTLYSLVTAKVGSPLPGVRLVTWTMLAVIHCVQAVGESLRAQ
jgi:hypothetical protein